MGATEEDNQIIQCYYPSSDAIDAICNALVATQGARDDAFILGSDKPVRRARPASDRIMLGESNRFHADGSLTDDSFHDDMLVSLDMGVGAMGVYGVNESAFGSAAQACLTALRTAHAQVTPVILGSPAPRPVAHGRYRSDGELRPLASLVEKLGSAMPGAVMTHAPEEFLSAVSDARDRGSAVLAVVAEPYLWAELSQSNFGKNGAKVDELIGLIGDEQVFVLVCAPDIKRMKVQAGWHDDAVPIRILSVGNPALLRQMVSTDVSSKIYEGSFNMARADIIKAY